MFPNYLFIQFDPEVIHTTTINSTRGVNAFVRFGRYPVTVPQEVIDTLQSPTPSSVIYSEENVPHSGDYVLITEGVFQDQSDIPRARRRNSLYFAIKNIK